MHRLSLGNTVFEGENNAYLFTEGPTTLVDTGISTPDTRAQLQSGLADHGLSFSDIERVFLTHYHADHSGLVGEIQAESDATVYVHEDDALLASGDEDAWSDLFETYENLFDQWGMPQAKQEGLVGYLDGSQDGYGEPATVETFTDGDRFDVAGDELEVLHAPGHTAGLCAFVVEGGTEVLTGDALLPQYTPNVGGADVRVDAPLAKYLDTLDRLAARDFERAWPGHRDHIDDPTARARHIQTHHEERALRVLRVLERRGSADAWTVSADLFGSLENIHVLHGPGESYAHLEHLRDDGLVVVEDGDYSLTEATTARLDSHEGDTWEL
ncbi:MBL fold metallo-hydrolase [Halorientalis litorea]|uniref:MBL fold metallo-hydrolase n=1 Tax=Halorientalis litorea TaxID=2931977 RepID=UPI001FF257F8|nr:MBL fold metallo-hydrolase [Halorientalis litorea]